MTEATESLPVDATLTAGDPPPVEIPADPPAAPETPEPARMVPQDVFVREITKVRGRAQEVEAAHDETRRQLQEARALLERFQRDPKGDAPAAPPPAAPRAADDDESRILRKAAELNFQQEAQRISEAGFKTHGQRWVDSINILNSFGLNKADFVSSVMDAVGREQTHEIMHTIAQDPEKAASLANMTPARQIAEIVRMSEKPKPAAAAAAPAAAAPARTVSRAPNPAPSIEPSTTKTVDWRSDDASEEEFTRGFNETWAKRAARR